MRIPGFRTGFRRRRPDAKPVRTYAIGDIHGCSDLLAELLDLIECDVQGRLPMLNRLVVLGDFIDRGPDSARIVDVFMRLGDRPNVVILKGNHEATMVDALDGDASAMEAWLDYGGAATLESYGLTLSASASWDLRSVIREARAAIPKAVVSWLRMLPVSYVWGDYFFVHAGVRPGVPLAGQTNDDLLWIREEFTDSNESFGAVVVHGHSIYEEGVKFGPHRIGVDTGAYRTGRLSAVGLESDQRWVVETGPKLLASGEQERGQ